MWCQCEEEFGTTIVTHTWMYVLWYMIVYIIKLFPYSMRIEYTVSVSKCAMPRGKKSRFYPRFWWYFSRYLTGQDFSIISKFHSCLILFRSFCNNRNVYIFNTNIVHLITVLHLHIWGCAIKFTAGEIYRRLLKLISVQAPFQLTV
jgi:hypothetical protein